MVLFRLEVDILLQTCESCRKHCSIQDDVQLDCHAFAFAIALQFEQRREGERGRVGLLGCRSMGSPYYASTHQQLHVFVCKAQTVNVAKMSVGFGTVANRKRWCDSDDSDVEELPEVKLQVPTQVCENMVALYLRDPLRPLFVQVHVRAECLISHYMSQISAIGAVFFERLGNKFPVGARALCELHMSFGNMALDGRMCVGFIFHDKESKQLCLKDAEAAPEPALNEVHNIFKRSYDDMMQDRPMSLVVVSKIAFFMLCSDPEESAQTVCQRLASRMVNQAQGCVVSDSSSDDSSSDNLSSDNPFSDEEPDPKRQKLQLALTSVPARPMFYDDLGVLPPSEDVPEFVPVQPVPYCHPEPHPVPYCHPEPPEDVPEFVPMRPVPYCHPEPMSAADRFWLAVRIFKDNEYVETIGFNVAARVGALALKVRIQRKLGVSKDAITLTCPNNINARITQSVDAYM